jgi:parvulin-like peptidyl-prolyl isomerase
MPTPRTDVPDSRVFSSIRHKAVLSLAKTTANPDKRGFIVKRGLLAGVPALFVALMVALVVGLAGCGSATSLPKNVLAQVGSIQITQDQFNKKEADFEAIYASQVPDKQINPGGYQDFERKTLDRMVNYEVVRQEAATLKISVTDAEVKAQIDKVRTNSFGGDQTKFDAGLKALNLTLEQLRTHYREEILLQKAYTEVTKDVSGASEAEIASYFESHRSTFVHAETRAARHILIMPVKPNTTSTTAGSATTTTAAPTEAQWATALATAQTVRANLVGGADWTAEAAKYSDDKGSKSKGGDLGSISKGVMVPEFEAAVFSLKLNEISLPVKTIYGYHIIQVTGITPAKQGTLAEAHATIQSLLLAQNRGLVWQGWLTKAKATLKVVIEKGMETTTTTTEAASPGTTAAEGSSTITAQPTVTTAPVTTATTASPITTAAQ